MRPEHQAVPSRYGLACYCGLRFDDTHALEDHLHAAKGDALAGRLAQRIIELPRDEESTWRPSVAVLIAWLAIAAVAFVLVRALA
jgi:hypothetical protein